MGGLFTGVVFRGLPVVSGTPILGNGGTGIDSPGNTIVAPVGKPIISGPIDSVGPGNALGSSGPLSDGTDTGIFSSSPVSTSTIDNVAAVGASTSASHVVKHPFVTLAVVVALFLLFL